MENCWFQLWSSKLLMIAVLVVLVILASMVIVVTGKMCWQMIKSPVEVKKCSVSRPSFSWSMLLSAIALMISVICLYCEFPNITKNGCDYNSVNVTILSILTAVLIGWQIFSIFEIKEIKKDVKNTANSNLNVSHRNQYQTHLSMSDFYMFCYNNDIDKDNAIYSCACSLLDALYAAVCAKLNQEDSIIDLYVKYICTRNIKFNDKQYKTLIDKLYLVKDVIDSNLFDKFYYAIKGEYQNSPNPTPAPVSEGI